MTQPGGFGTGPRTDKFPDLAEIIDGKVYADDVRHKVRDKVQKMKVRHGVRHGHSLRDRDDLAGRLRDGQF